MYIYIHINTYIYIHTHRYTHTHTLTHSRTHIHILTHAHRPASWDAVLPVPAPKVRAVVTVKGQGDLLIYSSGSVCCSVLHCVAVCCSVTPVAFLRLAHLLLW